MLAEGGGGDGDRGAFHIIMKTGDDDDVTKPCTEEEDIYLLYL